MLAGRAMMTMMASLCSSGLVKLYTIAQANSLFMNLRTRLPEAVGELVPNGTVALHDNGTQSVVQTRGRRMHCAVMQLPSF